MQGTSSAASGKRPPANPPQIDRPKHPRIDQHVGEPFSPGAVLPGHSPCHLNAFVATTSADFALATTALHWKQLHSVHVILGHDIDDTVFQGFLGALLASPWLAEVTLSVGTQPTADTAGAEKRARRLIKTLKAATGLKHIRIHLSQLKWFAGGGRRLLDAVATLTRRQVLLHMGEEEALNQQELGTFSDWLTQTKPPLRGLAVCARNVDSDDATCNPLRRLAALNVRQLVDLRLHLENLAPSDAIGDILADLLRKTTQLLRLDLAIGLNPDLVRQNLTAPWVSSKHGVVIAAPGFKRIIDALRFSNGTLVGACFSANQSGYPSYGPVGWQEPALRQLLQRNSELRDGRISKAEIELENDFLRGKKPRSLIAYAKRQPWMAAPHEITPPPSSGVALDKQEELVLTLASADCTAKLCVDDDRSAALALVALARGLVHSLEMHCGRGHALADEARLDQFLDALNDTPNLTTLLVDLDGIGPQDFDAARAAALVHCLRGLRALTTVTLVINSLPADADECTALFEQIRELASQRIALNLRVGESRQPLNADDFERLAKALSESTQASLHGLTVRASLRPANKTPHCSTLATLARLSVKRLTTLRLILSDMPYSSQAGEIVASLVRRSKKLQRLDLDMQVDFDDLIRRMASENDEPLDVVAKHCAEPCRRFDIGVAEVLEAMRDGNESLTSVSFEVLSVNRRDGVHIKPTASQHQECFRITARNCRTAASGWRDGALKGFAASWGLPPDLGGELAAYGTTMADLRPGHLIVSRLAQAVARPVRYAGLVKTLTARHRRATVARWACDDEVHARERRAADSLGAACVRRGLLSQQDVAASIENARIDAMAWMKRHVPDFRQVQAR